MQNHLDKKISTPKDSKDLEKKGSQENPFLNFVDNHKKGLKISLALLGIVIGSVHYVLENKLSKELKNYVIKNPKETFKFIMYEPKNAFRDLKSMNEIGLAGEKLEKLSNILGQKIGEMKGRYDNLRTLDKKIGGK